MIDNDIPKKYAFIAAANAIGALPLIDDSLIREIFSCFANSLFHRFNKKKMVFFPYLQQIQMNWTLNGS